MEGKIKKGFDRDIDLMPMKNQLITEFYKQLYIYFTGKYNMRAEKTLIFLIIELIQLRNGSRITEAINAFKNFSKEGVSTNDKTIVKICKSDGLKIVYDRFSKTRREIICDARYRKMMFPTTWIDCGDLSVLIKDLAESQQELLNNTRLRNIIYKYMIRNF